MGAGNSVEIPGGGSEGYHVLRVQENSPGFKAGLEPFFDFIVMIGNTRLNKDDDRLKDLLRANVEKPVKMYIYSSKTLKLREVTITPSSMWGGQGLLGVSIRFCSFEGANENVWHVLEVEPNSSAYLAGLRPFSDYIIGADSLLSEQDDLFTLIESHDGRQLKLFVYNSDTDASREVVITPNSAWGGEGSLGCGIGYGYLHRIPTAPFTEGKALKHSVPPAAGDAGIDPNNKSLTPTDGFAEVPLKTNVTPVEPITPPAATSSNLLPGNMGISIPTIPATFSADYTVPLTTYSSVASSTLRSTVPAPVTGLPTLVNISMPPTLTTNLPPLNLLPTTGIAPLPALPNLNLPPLTLPGGAQLPSLESLAGNLPHVAALQQPILSKDILTSTPAPAVPVSVPLSVPLATAPEAVAVNAGAIPESTQSTASSVLPN
ncbi:unnamed protein product [Clavelina lepadiformis]|uniref:PDZ GRASP-type domain-containing protein n=1 Tax=Clavelina lepadiformis TaxID=159417 RepID=A0ABP0F0P3_CLALP